MRKKVGEISESCLGKMLDKDKNKGELQPYLSNKSVRWGTFDLDNLSLMRFEEAEEERYGLKIGDLVVCEGGEPGRCAIWNGKTQKMKIQKALHRVRVKPDYDSHFLYYQFLLAGKTGDLDKYFIGSTIKHLTGVNLKQIEFNFPSLQIQQKIANVLSVLDAKIALNNRINAELEAMAKTLYDYWFVQFDFPNEANKPYKTSGGAMVWNEELKREIPEGWSVGTLANIGNIVGGSTPPKENTEYFEINGIPWITPRDLSNNVGNKFITRGEIDVSEKGKKAASLNIIPKGTVLLSSRAPIGYLAIARDKVTTNQGFKSFVPNGEYPTSYIYYTVKNLIPTIENKAVGSTFREVSATTLKGIETCLPPKNIIDGFSKKLDVIFEKQNLLELENQQLSALRDWLLPMLMNGQVVVGEK